MKKLCFGFIIALLFSITAVHADIVSYWNDYTQSVRSKVVSNFNPQVSSKTPLSVTVSLNIKNDGSVMAYRIMESSGNDDFDAAAMQAIRASLPFNPFPSDIIDHYHNMFLRLESSIPQTK